MRFFASLLIVIFAFGAVDLRRLHAQNPAAVSCCCHDSMQCECKTSAGKHACEIEHDFSGVSFKDWGCGIGHENPTSLVYSKDFYLFDFPVSQLKPSVQSFHFDSVFVLIPSFNSPIENPPELV